MNTWAKIELQVLTIAFTVRLVTTLFLLLSPSFSMLLLLIGRELTNAMESNGAKSLIESFMILEMR